MDKTLQVQILKVVSVGYDGLSCADTRSDHHERLPTARCRGKQALNTRTYGVDVSKDDAQSSESRPINLACFHRSFHKAEKKSRARTEHFES